ncbi:hypothetical protein B0H14DRAFT_3875861 [Mycena olivaceomarginata]|nr:hypothetical protein B0H14DRAFT_3875861 [Mycena olivaceomarginata]
MFVPPKLLNTPQNIATIAPSCLGSSNPSAVVLVILSTDPTPRVVSTTTPCDRTNPMATTHPSDLIGRLKTNGFVTLGSSDNYFIKHKNGWHARLPPKILNNLQQLKPHVPNFDSVITGDRYFFLKFKKPKDTVIWMKWFLPDSMKQNHAELRQLAELPEDQMFLSELRMADMQRQQANNALAMERLRHTRSSYNIRGTSTHSVLADGLREITLLVMEEKGQESHTELSAADAGANRWWWQESKGSHLQSDFCASHVIACRTSQPDPT